MQESNANYKIKYKELKLKFKDTVDLAFRLGVEEGMRQGQVQQAQQAQAAAQQQAQMSQMGQPGQDPNAQPGQEMPGQEQSDGSELDQHIGQLEGMLQGSKPGSPEQGSLKKSLDGIKAFRSSLKQASDLRKSEKAIAAIGKAMNPSFTLGKAATKNMSAPAQKALSQQEQIVNEMMKSFAEEEKKASEAITKTLNFEQLLKG
jgi:hypothetical protein